MNNSDVEKKLTYLQQNPEKLNQQEIELLIDYAFDPNFVYKYLLPELLMYRPSKKVEEALLQLTYSQDNLTRINAVDSLCIGTMDSTRKRLLILIKHDENHLVRAYSILSYFDVLENRFYQDFDFEFDAEQIYHFLHLLYLREKNIVVKAAYNTVFYKLRQKEHLADLMAAWDNPVLEYRDSARRWILGAFKDIVCETDADWYDSSVIKTIYEFLLRQQSLEENPGLKKDILNFLESITKMT